MDRYNEGYESGKRNAKYFDALSDIVSRYSHCDKSFIRGFTDAFNEYWENKLMERF